jgi:hypothetical protein
MMEVNIEYIFIVIILVSVSYTFIKVIEYIAKYYINYRNKPTQGTVKYLTTIDNLTHPTIKSISIGDRFTTFSDIQVEVIEIDYHEQIKLQKSVCLSIKTVALCSDASVDVGFIVPMYKGIILMYFGKELTPAFLIGGENDSSNPATKLRLKDKIPNLKDKLEHL